MCACGKQNINGTPGYSWDGETFTTRKPDPPALEDGDQLVFDEPGRCGGIDEHCHHYRLVFNYNLPYLLVRHGGGDERIRLSVFYDPMKDLVKSLDSNARFWLFSCIYHTVNNTRRDATKSVTSQWANAFVGKKIKKRKRNGTVSVWIDESVA